MKNNHRHKRRLRRAGITIHIRNTDDQEEYSHTRYRSRGKKRRNRHEEMRLYSSERHEEYEESYDGNDNNRNDYGDHDYDQMRDHRGNMDYSDYDDGYQRDRYDDGYGRRMMHHGYRQNNRHMGGYGWQMPMHNNFHHGGGGGYGNSYKQDHPPFFKLNTTHEDLNCQKWCTYKIFAKCFKVPCGGKVRYESWKWQGWCNKCLYYRQPKACNFKCQTVPAPVALVANLAAQSVTDTTSMPAEPIPLQALESLTSSNNTSASADINSVAVNHVNESDLGFHTAAAGVAPTDQPNGNQSLRLDIQFQTAAHGVTESDRQAGVTPQYRNPSDIATPATMNGEYYKVNSTAAMGVTANEPTAPTPDTILFATAAGGVTLLPRSYWNWYHQLQSPPRNRARGEPELSAMAQRVHFSSGVKTLESKEDVESASLMLVKKRGGVMTGVKRGKGKSLLSMLFGNATRSSERASLFGAPLTAGKGVTPDLTQKSNYSCDDSFSNKNYKDVKEDNGNIRGNDTMTEMHIQNDVVLAPIMNIQSPNKTEQKTAYPIFFKNKKDNQEEGA